jgi:hypothetical protein
VKITGKNYLESGILLYLLLFNTNKFPTMLKPGTILFSLGLLFLVSFAANAQTPPTTSCPNSNFNNGTFMNWTGCYGIPSNPCQTQGFDTSTTNPVHKIMTDVTALDPNTCNNLFKIFPGESFSARLGHDAGNTSAGSQLKYSFVVYTQPYWFKFRFAVVLDNGGHMPPQQPCFIIEIRDASGNLVDSLKSYQYYGAQYGLPGWQTCNQGPNTIFWKNWTTDSIDVSSFLGQSITATFTSKDCVFGGHHGYAYINAYCIAPINRQWTGAHSNLWNDPANWDPAGVPSSLDTVTIPEDATVMPLINVSGMTCSELHISGGAVVTILPGITITVAGNVVIDPMVAK